MHSLVKKRKKISRDCFMAGLILALAAIQNKFFDELISVMGMDGISLLLTLVLFFAFAQYLARMHGKFSRLDFTLMFYSFALIACGLIATKGSRTFLLEFRTLIYLVIGFLFFENIKLKDIEAIGLFRIAGLMNSLIYFFFYFQNVAIYGAGFRDVSINLYFSNFAFVLCLFVSVKGEKVGLKYVTALLCAVAIFTSQQRTQIIPLFISLIIYVLNNIGFSNTKKPIRLIVIVCMAIVVYKVAESIGVLELVLKRLQMSNMTSKSDTLFVRIDAADTAFSDMTIVNWLVGVGLTGGYDLEMLFPNLVCNYGIIGMTLLVYIIFLKPLSAGVRYFDSYKRFFLLAFLIISVGGVISGYAGQNGQLLIGAIMGLIGNKKVRMTKMNYSLPFVRIKLTATHTPSKILR